MTARLAVRGIDPERSCEAWLATILDGSFPLNTDGTPTGPTNRTRRNGAKVSHHSGRSPGAWRVPIPIPLAVVIP